MPISAPKPCTAPGCHVLVTDGSGRCAKHQRPAWTKPVTATKRITGRKLQALRAELFKRSPLCVHCAEHDVVTPATQRDHIIPLAEGGEDSEENTQGLCDECHDVKSKRESARGRGA